MNYFWELFKQTLRDMRQHTLRSLLAMFGIVWGTFSVVMLLALGEAYTEKNRDNVLGVSDNTLLIIPAATTQIYHGQPLGQRIQIKAAEAEQLRQIFPEIKWISPIIPSSKSMVLSRENQQINSMVEGVNADDAHLSKHKAQPPGHFFNVLDVQQQRHVIFISDDIKNKLFPYTTALSQEIGVNGIPFKIVGVAEPETKGSSIHSGDIAYIPYTTAIKLWGDMPVQLLQFSLHDAQQIEPFKYKLMRYLSAKYYFDPTDKQAVELIDLTQYTQFFVWFFRAIEIFLAFCGAMTLAIGGIGISNMMYLIVTERTSEIGLRMALGAKPKHILWQFILESSTLVILGSAIGLFLSMMSLKILQHVQLPQWLGVPKISIATFLVTSITLIIVTWVAGYFPAKRAANLPPMQALTF